MYLDVNDLYAWAMLLRLLKLIASWFDKKKKNVKQALNDR